MQASKDNNSPAHNGQTSIVRVMSTDDLIRLLVKRIVYFAHLLDETTSPTYTQFWLDHITSYPADLKLL
jgi:hypothetical protein